MKTMEVIWKYPISRIGTNKIDVPAGAYFLTAQINEGIPMIWAVVEPDNDLEVRIIEAVMTGQELEQGILVTHRFINTVQMHNGIVLHIFELK